MKEFKASLKAKKRNRPYSINIAQERVIKDLKVNNKWREDNYVLLSLVEVNNNRNLEE